MSPGEGTCVSSACPTRLFRKGVTLAWGKSTCVLRGQFSAGHKGLCRPSLGMCEGTGGAAGGQVQGHGLRLVLCTAPVTATRRRPSPRSYTSGGFAAVKFRQLEFQAAAVAET